MKFKKWIEEYRHENLRELNEWQKETGMSGIIPNEFDKGLLKQFIAYRSELHTKRLVWATWFLAIATIILSIFTLFIK